MAYYVETIQPVHCIEKWMLNDDDDEVEGCILSLHDVSDNLLIITKTFWFA